MINEDAGQTVLFFFLLRFTFFSQLFLKRKIFFFSFNVFSFCYLFVCLTINKDGLIT